MDVPRDILNNLRYSKLVINYQEKLETDRPLTFLNRVKSVPVFNDLEIIAQLKGGVMAANIVLNDAKALIVKPPTYEATPRVLEIPNLKIGLRVNQSDLEEYDNRKRLHPEVEEFRGWERKLAQQGVEGIRALQNFMCAGIFLDGFSYDRFGINTSSTFGMPSDLKVTLTGASEVTMGNLSTATPIDAIQALNYHSQITYGITYNYVDMSPELFQIVVQTDEFKSKLRAVRGLADDVPIIISLYDQEKAKAMFTEVTGMGINLESKSIDWQNEGGTSTRTKIFPLNKISLSNTSDFGDGSAYDFATTVTSEAKMSQLDPNMPSLPLVNDITSYYTFEKSYNPPSFVAWSVKRGYPRKNVLESTALITAYTP